MAEALQVVGAALGVAELALKIYNELSTFVERAKNAESTARDLRDKIYRFRKAVETVHRTAVRRERVSSEDEREIWAVIHESLEGWDRTLAAFKVGLERLRLNSSEDARFGWIDKTLQQLKLDRKSPWIGRLETAIGSHIDEITLSLNCLQITILGDTTSHVCRLDQRLERLTRSSTRSRSRSSEGALQANRHPTKEGIVKCVEVARSIRSRSSLYSESVESIQLKRDGLLDKGAHPEAMYQRSGTEDTDYTEFNDLISSSTSPASLWSHGESTSSASSHNFDAMAPRDDDPTPDFDDVTPQKVLNVLIPNYKKQIQVEIDDVCYAKAERYQRKVIECARESNEAYGSDYNIQELRHILAEILRKIDNDRSRQEAKNINTSLFKPTQPSPKIPQGFPVALEPEEERLEHAKIYLQRAEILCQDYLKTSRDLKSLESSEKYAKRAFKLALGLGNDGNQLLLQSVRHLIKVYELQHDNVAAQTYRDLFPDSRIGAFQPISSNSSRTTPTVPIPHSQLTREPTLPENSDLPNGFDSKANTLLVSAILRKNPTDVERILEQGADANQMSRDKSPIMHAIDSGVEIIVMKLRDKGANLNAELERQPPIIYAIERRDENMVRLLCELGVDIEASPRRNTPLLRAAQFKTPEIVRTLCKHDAKVNVRCSGDYTALHCAISSEYGPSRSKVCNTLQILLENGADPNAKDVEGKTPLHHAIQERDETCVKFMLDSSWPFDLEAQDNHGRTPLYLAISKRDYPLVELCLGKKPHIPERLPRDMSRPIKELIDRKRRESDESARSTSSEAAAEHPPFGALYRSFSTVTQAPPPNTSILRRWSLFGRRPA